MVAVPAKTEIGLSQHRDYFSVNARYDKVRKKPEYRHRRCIVPATAFVESQDGKHPHLLEPADGRAFAFGGIHKEWMVKVSGEFVHSASIITLPGIKPLENIHLKSVPMWLSEDADEKWLSLGVTDTGGLDYFLELALRCDLKATPIDKTFRKTPVGKFFTIPTLN